MIKSIKVKLTAWFTVILILISSAMMAVLVYIANYYGQNDTEVTLINKVQEYYVLINDSQFAQDILVRGDYNYFNSFDFVVDDIEFMFYHEDGSHSLGNFSNDGLDDVELKNEELRIVPLGKLNYYVYDMKLRIPFREYIWIRGVTPKTNDVWEILSRHLNVLLLVPVFIAIGIAGGWFLTKRLLRPMRQINETAEQIRTGTDLSKRIEIENTGDEFWEMSNHFNAMFDRLEETFEAQKRFTSNASHELRTPVSIILAQCDYAFDHVDSTEDMYTSLEAIQKQGYRMSNMIETLLIFTRIEQQTEKYPKVETDLSKLIQTCAQDYEIISDKNTHFECDLGNQITAKVNTELMVLLINNLLQNAVRYGKEDGHVWLKLVDKGNQVVFTVSDDGIGIDQKDIDKIWTRFYQVDDSRNTKGTGLGLSLVKQIAQYHNGDVDVKSTLGEGSTFTVTIQK